MSGGKAVLPRLEWFALVERAPVVVLSTRTYCFKEFLRRSSRALALPDGPQGLRRVLASAREHGLADGLSLPEIERAYLRRNWLALDGYRTAYLRREFPGLNLQPMAATQRKISQYYILYFLAARMAPKLHREHRPFDLTRELPSAEVEVDGPSPSPPPSAFAFAFVEAELAKLGWLTPESLMRSYPADGLLSGLIGRGFLFLGGKAYPLQEASGRSGGKGRLVINVAGGSYLISSSPACTLAEIERGFQRELEAFLQRQAREELPQRLEQQRAAKEIKRAVTQALRRFPLQVGPDGLLYLYWDSEGGIVRWRNGLWYVYLEVPAFVLQDPNAPGTYYYFDPTRVGLALEPGLGLEAGPEELLPGKAPFPNPVVLATDYEHPYVGPHTKLGGNICLGGRSSSEYDWSWWSEELSLEDAIYKYLLDAKYVLLGGYHRDNPFEPTLPLRSFAHRRISLQEVKRRKLKITNC